MHAYQHDPAPQPGPSRIPARRVVLGLGTLFLSTLFTASIIGVTIRHDDRLATAARELRTLDLLLAGETDRSFQSVRLVLDAVAAQTRLNGDLNQDILVAQASTRAAHDDLRARLSGLPQLDAVTIVAADGHIVNYSREWPVRYWNLADRPYFRAAARRSGSAPYISAPLRDRFTGQPTIYMVRRLNGADGSFQGIVIGAIRLSYFDSFYASLRLSPGEFIAVRQSSGAPVTRYPQIAGGPAQTRPIRSLAVRIAPGVAETRETGERGERVRRIVASTSTADFALRVDIGRDRAALMAEWRSEAFTVAFVVLLATLGTVLLLWALLRRWQALEFAAAASIEREQAILARREVEEALIQSQKMEAIGQLAGGIAHDFNNMLTVISGCLEMLRHKLEGVEPGVGRCLDNAEEGVRRANSLTARLLGFARKEHVRLVAIEVNAVIEGLAELLVRTLGNGVIVHTHLQDGLWNARGDASQLENAILNLCVNARDAMPDGGTVSIATANVILGDKDSRAADLGAGGYVEISVSDTGSGMPPSVAAKIFEPFFTTKGAGKGTGLGLSQVFVFARDAGGAVKVESALGAGAVFRIYLPRCSGD